MKFNKPIGRGNILNFFQIDFDIREKIMAEILCADTILALNGGQGYLIFYQVKQLSDVIITSKLKRLVFKSLNASLRQSLSDENV